MKFTYQLSIAFMMILLFVSGLSIVRSEEAPDSVTVKKGFKEGILKNMNVQKIEAASTCSPPPSSTQTIGGTSYTCYDLSTCDDLYCTGYVGYSDDDFSCCVEYTQLSSTASAQCASMGILCNSWSSPTGLFSLTYTNNNGQPSVSYVISDSLANQFNSNPSLSIGGYINTEDFYICTGTYDAAAGGIVSTNTGGCDLSKKSVNSGETYYFVTDSANYSWSISYPLGDGAIAGIVIGVLVFLGCCCGVIFVIMNNKKRAPPQPQTTIVQLGPGQQTQNPTLITTNAV